MSCFQVSVFYIICFLCLWVVLLAYHKGDHFYKPNSWHCFYILLTIYGMYIYLLRKVILILTGL